MSIGHRESAAAVRRLITSATAGLAAAGVGTPRVDAELLLAHVLDVPRSRLPMVDAITQEQADAFDAAVARRVGREPLQHITGLAPFRQVELAVGPGVFVPRPETELLVDAVLPVLGRVSRPVAVDLCAGSGALAVALAGELPGCRVFAVERPGPAVDWLRRNSAETGVQVVVADLADPGRCTRPPLDGVAGQVDAVVCNPPYVPATTPVEAEVRADPAEAVFAGPDGLALMPAVIATAAELLRPGGVVAVEHDASHGAAVPGLFRTDGRWAAVADHRDLAGRPRYTTATRARP